MKIFNLEELETVVLQKTNILLLAKSRMQFTIESQKIARPRPRIYIRIILKKLQSYKSLSRDEILHR